jgi:CBS domain-containing protein
MKKVSQLLYKKGNAVTTVEARTSVYDALERMVEGNFGAMVVLHEGEFAGLMTERDYARKVVLKGKASKETSVAEIMNSKPATVTLNDTIEHCMELMSDKHIRYLPVLSEGHVVGLVSMGDLVRFIIEDQDHTIRDLKNYISGSF